MENLASQRPLPAMTSSGRGTSSARRAAWWPSPRRRSTAWPPTPWMREAVKKIYAAKGRPSRQPADRPHQPVFPAGAPGEGGAGKRPKAGRRLLARPPDHHFAQVRCHPPADQRGPGHRGGAHAPPIPRPGLSSTRRGCPWRRPRPICPASPAPPPSSTCGRTSPAGWTLLLDGGDCDVGVESTVLTLATPVPRLLRPGGVTLCHAAAGAGPGGRWTRRCSTRWRPGRRPPPRG